MRKIELLDENTIDKIAAGEVVERPASVVKELMENAIDASATAITVEIREGGKTFIRITDNGEGMEKDEVRKAFLRHATSKIRSADDLQQIMTLGFRGEALSSIAAVSQMEVITKTADALTGVRCRIEGGREVEFEEIGAPSGTTFLINHLFYNVPARAKFLKTPAAEGSRVASVVEELALSHPEISFKFIMNGQNRLYTGGNGNLKEIIYQIYGRDMTKGLIPVDRKTELMHISGFIADPSVSRNNRNFENYFINRRYVKSPVIAKAIEDGYHGFLMQHKYPFTLLYIDIDPTKVDVNVHPSKMEVRISEQEQVYHQLCLAVQNTLMERERIPEVSPGREEKDPTRGGTYLPKIGKKIPEPFENRRREKLSSPTAKTSAGSFRNQTDNAGPFHGSAAENESRVNVPENKKQGSYPAGVNEEANRYSVPVSAPSSGLHSEMPQKENSTPDSAGSAGSIPETSSAPEQLNLFRDKLLSEDARGKHKIIGQIFGTFWIVEFDDRMYIIDQHAAHEKVLYERIMKNYKEKKINSQILYPAKVVSLPAAERDVLERNMSVFRSLGFEIEPFGGNDYKITAVPDNLYSVADNELFNEVMDQLTSLGDISPEAIPEKLASMSCKAAIKGNHDYSLMEAEALIDELLKLENPYNCPHGRPTIISMSHYELDKKFKRIV